MKNWIKYKKWLNAEARLGRTMRRESNSTPSRIRRANRARRNAYRQAMKATASDREEMIREGVVRHIRKAMLREGVPVEAYAAKRWPGCG